MTTTNKTVLDLSKVQHGTLWYENEFGHRKNHKPNYYTYCGNRIASCIVNETNKHRMDTWLPLMEFQLTANHCITYRGKKAISLWKAWNERIFNKQQKNK